MTSNTEKANDNSQDINIGNATICFDSKKLVWVKPGGDFIFTEKRARKYCQKLSDFMEQIRKAA